MNKYCTQQILSSSGKAQTYKTETAMSFEEV